MKSPKIKMLPEPPGSVLGGVLKVSSLFIILIIAVIFAVQTGMLDTSRAHGQSSDIAIGDIISGKLDETDTKLNSGQLFDEYHFMGNVGEKVLINLSAFDFDAFLWLLNSDGEAITINDDSGDATGAMISNFELPETGIFTIWVASYNAGQTGAYTLSLSQAPVIYSPDKISIGNSVRGKLNRLTSPHLSTGQFYQAYTFEASHGKAVSVEMYSRSFDTCLWLLDKDGNVITLNDDAIIQTQIKGYVSRIIFFAPVSDTYTLLASSGEPAKSGKYTLTLDTIPTPIDCETLSKTVSGQLDTSDYHLNSGHYLDVYILWGNKGERVTLGLSSSDFDSHLRILDGNGNVVNGNDDGGGGEDALIADLVLPATGAYYVWTSSVFAGGTGDYVLSFGNTVQSFYESRQTPLDESDNDGIEGVSGDTNDDWRSIYEPLPEPPGESGSGTQEGVKLIFSRKGGSRCCSGGGMKMLEEAPQKKRFLKPYGCLKSESSYKAKVNVCIGNRKYEGKIIVFCDNPKILIKPKEGIPVTVEPNKCELKEPFEIVWKDAPSGTYTIKVRTEPKIGDDFDFFYIIRVDISPSDVNATESLNSKEFTATITPVPPGVTPSYQWLTDGAWPPTAGNNPELDYSAPTAQKTIVKKTRWFAKTPSRKQVVDGCTCIYNINCEITVGDQKCKDDTPSKLNVDVDLTGQTTRPTFANWNTITVAKVGAQWVVTGQGTFQRTAPVPSVNPEPTSQFHLKAMTHENKHVTQYTSEAPWKDLFDANKLYTNTLSTLTSMVSEADLRDKIWNAVKSQHDADTTVADNTMCDREKGAFDAMNAVDPDFLELDDIDWKPLYGCGT
jgi:hypothetical protein